MSVYDLPALLAYCCVMAALLGAVMGSFLNCAAWRIAHGESFIKGRSHCPVCQHVLEPRDLIPCLSWIILRGRCRFCGTKLSVRYPLTELGFAIVSVVCLLRFDLTVVCLRNWIFLCCLFCLALADLESMEIPDGCLLTALAAWVVSLPWSGMNLKEIGMHILAGVIFGAGLLILSLIMDKVLGRESLGGGDIKLFGLIGLYLGIVSTLFTVILACIMGLIFGALYKASRSRGGAFPFGPAIAAAAAVMLLFGSGLADWYTGLF